MLNIRESSGLLFVHVLDASHSLVCPRLDVALVFFFRVFFLAYFHIRRVDS